MSDWSDLGLPCPTVEQYGYELDAGLVRTKMDSGYTMQRRKYTTQPTIFTLRWLVDGAELQSVSNAINTIGYSWFTMGLITGTNGSSVPTDHTVRMVSEMAVAPTGKNAYSVTIKAEQAEAGNSEPVANPDNVVHTELADVQINMTHDQIDSEISDMDTRTDAIETEQAVQNSRLGTLEGQAAVTDTEQGVQDAAIASNAQRLDDTDADQVVQNDELARLESVKADAQDVLDIFSYAAYLKLQAASNTATADIGAGWLDLDFITTQSITPLGFTNENTGKFSCNYPGVFQLGISGAFEHVSVNFGRLTNIRIYNYTDDTSDTGMIIPTGRNQEATSLSIATLFQVSAADVGKVLGFQIGGGDTYTAVNFQTISYFLMNVGLWEGAL